MKYQSLQILMNVQQKMAQNASSHIIMMVKKQQLVDKLGGTSSHGVQQELMKTMRLLTTQVLGIGARQHAQYRNDKGFSGRREESKTYCRLSSGDKEVD